MIQQSMYVFFDSYIYICIRFRCFFLQLIFSLYIFGRPQIHQPLRLHIHGSYRWPTCGARVAGLTFAQELLAQASGRQRSSAGKRLHGLMVSKRVDVLIANMVFKGGGELLEGGLGNGYIFPLWPWLYGFTLSFRTWGSKWYTLGINFIGQQPVDLTWLTGTYLCAYRESMHPC